MHVIFKTIRLVRFRSFLNETFLEFGSAGPGLYFLKGKNNVHPALGSNGSGKSSLIDALMWCLYGKTVQGLKNPDVTPWTGKGQTIVEITLLIDDQEHIVKRTIGPNLITIDGQEASQEYINKLIPIPFELIPYTIILGQRQPLFFDLTASEKLKLLSECMQLERWDERSQHAAELVKNLEIEVLSKDAEIASFEKEIARNNTQISELKEKSSDWEGKRQVTLESSDKQKILLQKQVDKLLKDRDDADLQLDRAETEIRAVQPIIDKLRKEHRALSAKSVQLERDFKHAVNKEAELEEMLDSIKEELCPTCNQPIKAQKQRTALVANIKQQIEALNIEEMSIQQKAAAVDSVNAQKAIEAHEKSTDTFVKQADDARDILDHLTPQIAKAEAEIKAIDKIKQEYENQDNPYKEQITSFRKRKNEIDAKLNEAAEFVKQKKEHSERARYWVKGFKDIKLYTLEEILQELEITTNGMLGEFGLIDWKVKYDVERETKSGTVARGMNIAILTPAHKSSVKWESWSGGEAQRLRLIGSVALSSVLLNHIGVTTNLAIFDEPTESLSKEGVSDLVELLAQHAKDSKKNVWFVDHHTIESSHFISVTTITKDKFGSYIAM